MKIYTKTGDQGETSLVGGKRVSKSCDLLDAYGTIDELNAAIGVALAEEDNTVLQTIQHRLFTVGGMLATETDAWEKYWGESDVEKYTRELECEIDRLSTEVEPMRGFILPQGNRWIAQLHVCRTVCRRAERIIAKLIENEPQFILLLKYMNRLADLLFILARYAHKRSGVNEITWKSDK